MMELEVSLDQIPVYELSLLWTRLLANVERDKLSYYIITSQSGGFEPSDGVSFGAGKSSLAIFAAYRCFAFANGTLEIRDRGLVDFTPEKEKIQIMKMVVTNFLKFKLADVLHCLAASSSRIPAIIWDDVQGDCPSFQNIPKRKRLQMEQLTRARQKTGNLIMTSPSVSDVAKPLRRNLSYEILVPRTGIYEVQIWNKKRDYRQPINDRVRMSYDSTGTFPRLPAEVDALYKKIRDECFVEDVLNDEGDGSDCDGSAGVEKHELECSHCGHVWMTASKSWNVTCASCGMKVRNQF
jgi:hypothetical protein